jgi:hypothetical protein
MQCRPPSLISSTSQVLTQLIESLAGINASDVIGTLDGANGRLVRILSQLSPDLLAVKSV